MKEGTDVLAYSYDEAARVLGVSKQTIIRLVKDGKLCSKQLGRRVVIPRDALEGLLL